MILSKKVRELREAHNLSVHELAELTQIAVGTIYNIENGHTKNVGLPILTKFANTFNTPIEEFEAARNATLAKYRSNMRHKERIKAEREAKKTEAKETEVIPYENTPPTKTNKALVELMKYMYKLAQLSANAQATIFELIDKLS